jgi:hypothetical protein
MFPRWRYGKSFDPSQLAGITDHLIASVAIDKAILYPVAANTRQSVVDVSKGIL